MEFRKTDVEKILGIKRTKLQEWINFGLVQPFKGAPGQGVPNIFHEVDLYIINFLELTIFRGISRKKAADMVEAFRRTFRMYNLAELPNFLIFCAKYSQDSPYRATEIMVQGPNNPANFNQNLAEKYDEVLFFNLRDIKKRVDKSIKEFNK